MISVVFRILAAAVVLVVAHPALAEWHKAESDRFVIYSDSRPEDIAEYARMLERYHAAMELETGRRVPVPSPSNRLTVYLVGTIADVRESQRAAALEGEADLRPRGRLGRLRGRRGVGLLRREG